MSRAGDPAVTESFQAQGSRSAHVPGAEDGDVHMLIPLILCKDSDSQSDIKDISPVEETVGSGFG